jgi:5-formyltetrahydrofolate cyclo-ligase
LSAGRERRAFASKAEARRHAWDRLAASGEARFPLPPHGRIPNFAGADDAASRLFEHEPWKSARAIKVNPDSPQLPVRELALRRGIRVYVPTPKLAGGFRLLDPDSIPADKRREAAALSTMQRWSREVALHDLPQLDAIVTGCAAATIGGKRSGKGAGYSDLEFAILRELGHAAVPVATTVHDAQIVADFPTTATDLPLSLIATPTRVYHVVSPPAAPDGIRWELLDDGALDSMPVLAELKRLVKP